MFDSFGPVGRQRETASEQHRLVQDWRENGRHFKDRRSFVATTHQSSVFFRGGPARQIQNAAEIGHGGKQPGGRFNRYNFRRNLVSNNAIKSRSRSKKSGDMFDNFYSNGRRSSGMNEGIY